MQINKDCGQTCDQCAKPELRTMGDRPSFPVTESPYGVCPSLDKRSLHPPAGRLSGLPRDEASSYTQRKENKQAKRKKDNKQGRMTMSGRECFLSEIMHAENVCVCVRARAHLKRSAVTMIAIPTVITFSAWCTPTPIACVRCLKAEEAVETTSPAPVRRHKQQ